MFKYTKATKYIVASAKRCKYSGVDVDVNEPFSWVTISCDGEEDIFLQGEDADQFIAARDIMTKRYPSLPDYVAELALAEPYTDLWS